MDHVDAAEARSRLRAGCVLLNTAHQPVAGAIEQRGDGTVVLGDCFCVENIPQFRRTVVQRKGVVHSRFWPTLAHRDQKHLAVSQTEHVRLLSHDDLQCGIELRCRIFGKVLLHETVPPKRNDGEPKVVENRIQKLSAVLRIGHGFGGQVHEGDRGQQHRRLNQ